MKEHELRNALSNAVEGCQLSEYRKRQIVAQMKGEEPVKKKLTVSVVLVMVIMLLTLSAAAALVHSTIVDHLFGSSENAPSEVTERIQATQQTASSALGVLSLDEWFYDGQALHTAFSISNPTNEALFYTLDGIHLNGQHITYNRLRTEGAGDSGFLLGGTVDGSTMPASVSLYNQGDALYRFDENGKYMGTESLPEGKASVKISVAVWKPVNPVQLVDYRQYEGINTSESADHLIVDKEGFCQLWLLRPDKYNLNYNASQSGAEIYKDAYKELGWMEFQEIIELEVPLTLSKDEAVRAIPQATKYEMDGFELTLEQFDFSHAGGKLLAKLSGAKAQQLLTPHGFRLVDLKGERILCNGCYWNDRPDEENDIQIGMELLPVSTALPEIVYFVPATDYRECYDPVSPYYDPSLEKPENVIEGWELDLANAIPVQLNITR